ncbi:MAG: hypothetical protein FGM15_06100 [Chthoniobacterales bacterium]|nr:hypothetical protein [Chthoniobacterales bacterium]
MARRDRRRKAAPRVRRLNASFAASPDAFTVPVRWVKAIVGIFLLPPCYILTAAFFSALFRAADQDFHRTAEFLFFAAGSAIWLFVFFVLPRPLWIYVFGHELTHALAVRLAGGQVLDFNVSREGGHVVTDKINTWIALAPYFIPIYSVIVIALYGLGSVFYDLEPYRPLLYVLLGFTWTFHATFTLSMIPKGQTDLAYGGHFFSLLVIYLMNLLVLSFMLLLALPQQGGFRKFARDILLFSADFAVGAKHVFDLLVRAAGY